MILEDWLACDDPLPMLTFLSDRGDERKLRLFAVACCRRYWHLYRPKRMRTARAAVETAEHYADGRASEDELRTAVEAVQSRVARKDGDAALAVQLACTVAVVSDPHVGSSPADAARDAAWSTSTLASRSGLIEREAQAALLRDFFRPAPKSKCDPYWLSWEGGLIPAAARQMYRAHNFVDLPVLGDMLEEAGCADEAVLEHCRHGGEHVRGCWAVDWVLGLA
jgi:hypothetical protein